MRNYCSVFYESSIICKQNIPLEANMQSKLNFITMCAMKALLYEVSAAPKPGLVDRLGPGAHDDMDYFTFVDSTLALQETFYECAEAGVNFKGENPTELLEALRPIGILGEEKMLQATDGVNTHKGAIFSLGILCAAAGRLISESSNAHALCEYVKQMAFGLTKELNTTVRGEALTSGERLYKSSGILGIRGEVEAGFPSVMEFGLPALQSMSTEGLLDRNEIMIQTLIELMYHVDDTNVLSRKGVSGLNYVRNQAKKALELGGVYTEEGWYFIVKLDQEFTEKNISPGGTADMLAVTLMLHFLSSGGRLC